MPINIVDSIVGVAIARMSLIVIDCPDPGTLARFYGAMLGWKTDVSADRPSACSDGQCISFHRVADYTPPTWPSQEQPQQMHLDLIVNDLDAAEAAVIDLGPTRHADGSGCRALGCRGGVRHGRLPRTAGAEPAVHTECGLGFLPPALLHQLRPERTKTNRWIVFVINSNAEAFELDDAVTRRGRLDKAARMGHPVLAAQLRYLRAWRSRSTGDHLDEERLSWFSRLLEVVDEQMGQQREQLEQQISKLQRDHPGRGDTYRKAWPRSIATWLAFRNW